MSVPAEVDNVENLEFKWLKKRGVGGKKKEVQFYESFTYDGMDYALHDCVYMHKDGEPEPFIGKLIKIWENPDKSKKVKVQWFFRPSEILNWLGDEETMENEIFFASGEGLGVANVNPLEAISGRCNVVCISKDCRNPQPSEEDLKMADYVFYRTFDVGRCSISNKMDDKVGGLDVKFIFNRKDGQNASGVPKHDSEMKQDNKNAIACKKSRQLAYDNHSEEFKVVKTEGNCDHLVAKEDAIGKGLLVKRKATPEENIASGAVVDSSEVDLTRFERISVSFEKTTRCKEELDKEELKVNEINEIKDEDRLKSAKGDGLDDRPAKKARIDDSIRLSKEKNVNSTQQLTASRNENGPLVKNTNSEEKSKSKLNNDSLVPDKGVKPTKDSSALEERLPKKAKFDNCGKLSQVKDTSNVYKLNIKSNEKAAKDLVTSASSFEEKTKFPLSKDSLGPDKGKSKENANEKMRKLSNDKLPGASLGSSTHEDKKVESQSFEVTRRPDVDKSKWFRELPWEERIQSAHDQSTLILLQNLDPVYTSGEVEDIIWHAFKENCTAKTVQHTAISSPHSGRAFVIFKTREAALRVIRRLDGECLMLPNGRPLVASIGPPPTLPGKQSVFVGHLSIDKIKLQMQREMKEAVSTSHCSQPNTIEYEMAMEWCLLQSRSDIWWKKLYEKQGEELRSLKDKLKSK